MSGRTKSPEGQSVWKTKTYGRTKHPAGQNIRQNKMSEDKHVKTSKGTTHQETKDPFDLFTLKY
jgi:hypothetical protein